MKNEHVMSPRKSEVMNACDKDKFVKDNTTLGKTRRAGANGATPHSDSMKFSEGAVKAKDGIADTKA